MEIIEAFITQNDGYVKNVKRDAKGVMVHSVGCPQPDAQVFIDAWNHSGVEKNSNAIIDEKGVHIMIPPEVRSWHAGRGVNGSANDTHISFEITEPAGFTYDGATMVGYDVEKNTPFFKGQVTRAVEYAAKLCKDFNLTVDTVISHKEGADRGIASAHVDPDHWFKMHNYTMDDFRAAVTRVLAGGPVFEDEVKPDPVTPAEPATPSEPEAPAEPVHKTYEVTSPIGLNLRSSPSTSGKILSAIRYQGRINGVILDNGWIKTDFPEGYIYSRYVREVEPATAPSTPVTPTSPAPAEPEPSSSWPGVINAGSGLRLRKGPGTGYVTLSVIPYGAKVEILAETNGWGKVIYNSNTGYVSLAYVVKAQATTPESVIPYKVTTTAGLNVRSEPNGTKIGALIHGTIIQVSSIQNGWAEISYQNRRAYVSAAYIAKV